MPADRAALGKPCSLAALTQRRRIPSASAEPMSATEMSGSHGVTSERNAGGPAALGKPLCSGLPTYRALRATDSAKSLDIDEAIARRYLLLCFMCRSSSTSRPGRVQPLQFLDEVRQPGPAAEQ